MPNIQSTSDGFFLNRYYCGHCLPLDPKNKDGHAASEYDVKKHVEEHHGIPYRECDHGTDYFLGLQAQRIYTRRKVEHDQMISRATKGFAAPSYSVKDFLADCEVGA